MPIKIRMRSKKKQASSLVKLTSSYNAWILLMTLIFVALATNLRWMRSLSKNDWMDDIALTTHDAKHHYPKPVPIPQPYMSLGRFWNHSLNETTRRDNIDPSPYSTSSAWPYISTDVWYESVDNNRTFFGRRWFDYDKSDRPRIMGNYTSWMGWLNQLQWPVSIAISANNDYSWPSLGYGIVDDNDFGGLNVSVLDHPMLAKLFIMNPSIVHPKVMPLPIGLKWQFRSHKMYSESKRRGKTTLHSTVGADGPDSTKELFKSTVIPPRTNTVWVRPGRPNKRIQYDETANDALSTRRSGLCNLLSQWAPNSLRCHSSTEPDNNHDENNNMAISTTKTSYISMDGYYQQLKQHRFVASPPGHGLDTHGTWEALVAGCIPIVPHSPLDPMFDDLPVWLIHSWKEVNDVSIPIKAKEMLDKVNDYHWDKVYVSGWIKAMDEAAIEAAAAATLQHHSSISTN